MVTLVALAAPAPALAIAAPGVGCAGLSFADARGDSTEDAFGLGFGPAGPPRTDLVAGWLREDGGRLTANLQVADLSAAPPAGGGSSAWTFNWFAGAQRFYVQAEVDANGTRSFSYGTYDESSASFRPEMNSPIEGEFFEGANGVVQVVLPARHAQGGLVLERPFAETAQVVGGSRAVADRAPDGGEGEGYRVGGCLEGPTPSAPKPPAAKPKAETLPLRAANVVGSAKKASKRRSLGFKVRGLKTITGLKVRLVTTKGRVLAAGGLRRLKGISALKLDLRKSVRLREGFYLLRASGNVGKRPLRAVLKVAVRA